LKDTVTKKLSFMSKCSKWTEKWPKICHKSLKETGEMANRVVEAIIKKLQSKTLKSWDSILVREAHQDSKMIRKRTLSRKLDQSLIKTKI